MPKQHKKRGPKVSTITQVPEASGWQGTGSTSNLQNTKRRIPNLIESEKEGERRYYSAKCGVRIGVDVSRIECDINVIKEIKKLSAE